MCEKRAQMEMKAVSCQSWRSRFSHSVEDKKVLCRFNAQVGSSTVLREGVHSLPSSPENETSATVTLAASIPLRRNVFEGFKQVEGHDLGRVHAADGQQEGFGEVRRSKNFWPSTRLQGASGLTRIRGKRREKAYDSNGVGTDPNRGGPMWTVWV